jgi:phosphoglycolate phosphatase
VHEVGGFRRPPLWATLRRSMGRRVVLWDVDGTLVRSSRTTRALFDAAVAQVLGRHPGEHGVPTSGRTDPGIALDILAWVGLGEEEARRRLPSVIGRLEADVAAAADGLRQHTRVLPGVEEVLARLHADPAVVQSVLTGNTAANAAVKLGAFGLDRWLDLEVGAFGSDDADRGRLVPVALERILRKRGLDVAPEDVWVVGDTPADLACARAGGTRCVLVATGILPVGELSRLGADRVLADLSATDEVCELLTS